MLPSISAGFQKSLILAVIGVEAQGQFKAAITADHFFLTIGKFGASEEKSFASSLFLIIGHALDGNATEALFLLRICAFGSPDEKFLT